AVNKGFKLANGELIGWLNSDDVYFDEEVISDMVDFFSKNNVDIAYGDRVIINKNNLLLRVHHIYPQFNYDMLKRVCYISQPSTFFSKNVIEEHKLDPDIDLPMDYDYWLRLADDDYNFRHIDRIVAGYRNHENAKTQSMKTKLGQQVKEVRSRHIDDLDDRKISKIKDNAVLAYNRLRGVQTMVEIYNKRRDLKFASEFKFDSLPKGIWRQLTYPQLSNNA
ncbi:MAG: glycosyltransferase, partial [Candidatus Paceibacteria bacterium]